MATTTRKLAAIMFTDIVGYTALMGSDEDKAFEVLRKNREIHSEFIQQFNGTLIKEMGDGMLISFDLASDAVRCAIEMQKACKSQEIPLKIGIHEGEMVFEGADVLGDGVNITSRIQDGAEEGCILISGSVYRDIKNKSDIQTEYVGERLFKNVDESIKVYKVICDDVLSATISGEKSESKIPEKKSIIVLPFVNLSPDPDQEYFSDGLTEEIITDLSFVKDLLVISRSSAMSFKETKKKIRDIAREVNVRYVLEGSVRKFGNNLRIVAQLIDGTKDTHIWAEKYNGTLDDVFDIQEKVSQSIVDSLKLNLTPEEEKKLVKHPIPETNANDFYLRARHDIMRFTDEGLNKALISLQSALDITGPNARLYAEIGFAHMNYVNMGIKPEEHMDQAMEYADKALELDPNSTWANFNKAGHALLVYGDLKEAINYMNFALDHSPYDPNVLFWAAWIHMMTGKFVTVYPMIDLAMKVDPLNPLHYMTKGGADFFSGQFNVAVENCLVAYKMEPENPMISFWHALSLAYLRRYEEAINIIEKHLKNAGLDIMTQQAYFLKLILRADFQRISQLSTEDFFTKSKKDCQHSYHNACFYSFINHKESALEWLENAVSRGFIIYPLMNSQDPFLENIRGESRFKKLMKKVKYEWEHFEI